MISEADLLDDRDLERAHALGEALALVHFAQRALDMRRKALDAAEAKLARAIDDAIVAAAEFDQALALVADAGRLLAIRRDT